jgi:exonuclease VII small subunit
MRKSLQGLDYFSADGAKAFDDLQEVVEKLGDCYQRGMSWSKEMSKKLKLAKRYLKGDYKVSG